MELQLCTVPWDVGEAHVGQRTISGIGNVVYFGSKENRNAWFDAIPDSECYRFETKFKELHREQVIDVPIPYDVAARFNYLRVKYHLFANDDSPVQYETADGLKEWFWFVREVEFVAPNTTRLHLLDDAFQTWIYDVEVSGMVLERGHAPMFSTRAGKFLENPIANNTHLLTEDVNYGDATQVSYTDAVALNANDVYACIATSAVPTGNWGTKAADTWRVPASASYTNNGVPSVFVFAVEPANLNSFIANVTRDFPQFKQTVQGVFFASADLLTLGATFEFASTTCYRVSSSRNTLNLSKLDTGMFGYDARYVDIAKLYTYPYAHIEVVDENGNTDIIKIEDTTGTIDVSVSLSLAYPFVNIDAHLLGIGGSDRRNITFRNISSRTFEFGGTWYETLHSWKVPTFAVVLDAATENDYSTHFDRKQARTAYENAYSSSIASAETARDNAYRSADTAKANADASADTLKANADASADTLKANADASADTLVSNTAIQVAANSTITAESNARALSDASLSNALAQALQAWESGYARETVNNEVNAEYASAAIGAAGGAINSAVSGAMSGAALGPVGAVAGAVGGLVSGAIGGATSMAQTAVAANLKSSQAEASISLSQSKVNETSTNNTDRTSNQNAGNSANVATTNSASTGTSANSAATERANASRSQATMKANASREQATAKANASRMQATAKANAADTYSTAIANAGRTRNTAQNAIENSIAQAALRSPFMFGNFADGDSATTKPIALFSNIVTQSKSAIASAGDEFLRYGYMFDKQWDFDGDWNIGKYFTYWKLKDFWVRNLNVPDLYMDKLRFFLFGGVTVWRAPEDIGNIDVYENYN